MRALAGFTLLLAAVAYIAFDFNASTDERDAALVSVAEQLRLSTPEAAPAVKKTGRPRRTFSPRSTLFAQAIGDIAKAEDFKSAAAAIQNSTNAPAAAPGWSTVVAMDSATPPGPRSLTPSRADATWELARDLHQELKRVGCYDGPIDGAWRASSKEAMAHFVERVNAALPSKEPDYALLALVRGHAARICGAACAPGEAIGRDGRCLPATVLAEAPADRPAVSLEVSRRPVAPLPGRMGAGGPLPKAPAEPENGERGFDVTRGLALAYSAITAYASPTNAVAALATEEPPARAEPPSPAARETPDSGESAARARVIERGVLRRAPQAATERPRIRRAARPAPAARRRIARVRSRPRSYARPYYRRYVSVGDIILRSLRH